MLAKFWPVLIPVAVGACAFGYTRWEAGGAPRAAVEAAGDLGLRDNNKLVTSRVLVRNEGRRELVLSNLRTSCAACLSFAAPDAAEGVISLAPGGATTVEARVMVHGTPEKPFAVGLSCDTNDPRQPTIEVVFSAQVRGWLTATPTSLDLGALKPGEVVARTIRVRDTGRGGEPFRVGRVETPQGVRVASPGTQAPDSAGEGFGVLVASVTAPTPGPSESGLVSGEITIHEDCEGGAKLVVPIRGEVPAKIAVTPPALVLPRLGGGGADFAGECTLALASGTPAPVSLLSTPPELSVSPAGPPSDGRFRFEWKADRRPPPGELRTAVVRFRVGSDEVAVAVRCLTPGAP